MIGPDSALRFEEGDTIVDDLGGLWRIKRLHVEVTMSLVAMDYQPLREGAEAILPVLRQEYGAPDDPRFSRRTMRRLTPEAVDDRP